MKIFEIFGGRNGSAAQSLSPPEYYTKLGNRTRFAAVACAIVFAVVVMFAASSYNDEINIENLRYMLKFLDPAAATVKQDDVISFDYDENNYAVSLGGSIAVCDRAGIDVFDTTGERLQTETFRNETPLVKCNGKYVYMCGAFGTELRVYTAYRRYHTETFEYPITDLAISDSGQFAVATSVKSYRSAVIVYNSYFKQVLACRYGDKYVSGTAISADGKRLVNALQYSDGGDLIAELILYDISSGEQIKSHSYTDELPLKVHCFKNGCAALLTDKALRTYDSTGEMISETDVSADRVTGFVGGDTSMAVYRAADGLGSGCEVTLCASDGNVILTETLSAEPVDLVANATHMYMLTRGELYIYDISGQTQTERIECDTSVKQVLCDDTSVILVSGDSARVLRTFK